MKRTAILAPFLALSMAMAGLVSAAQGPSTVPPLNQRAEAGDAEAQHELGTNLREGKGIAMDPVAAAHWFQKAANQGHACACFDLGMCYAMGAGLNADPKVAMEWFQKAADLGHAEAMTNLGIGYHEGMGRPRDLAMATSWFRKAANLGNATAMLNLGVALVKGEGVPRNRAEAFHWFQQAHTAGEPNAKAWLDQLEKDGFGRPGVENSVGIIHGPNHAYSIKAPPGWVLDNAIWADQGIHAVFYEAQKSPKESKLIAYTMVQEKTPGGLDAHIEADLVYTLKGSKTAKVERKPSLKTQDGREARVLTIQGVPGQHPEWMAYIDAPTVVIVVSVSAPQPGNFLLGEGLLKDLVSSISWFTDQVTYPKAK